MKKSEKLKPRIPKEFYLVSKRNRIHRSKKEYSRKSNIQKRIKYDLM